MGLEEAALRPQLATCTLHKGQVRKQRKAEGGFQIRVEVRCSTQDVWSWVSPRLGDRNTVRTTEDGG